MAVTHAQSMMNHIRGALRAKWGPAFGRLGPEMQTALVRAAALEVLARMESVEGTPAEPLIRAAMAWEPSQQD